MRWTSATIALSLLSTSTVAMVSPIHDSISLGFRAGSNVLLLRTISTGCTRRDDFRFELDDERHLSVSRTRADTCRARPRTVEFEYDFDELGLEGEVYLGRSTFER